MKVIAAWGLSQWDNTLFSYYRGWRWGVLLRELVFLPHSLHALWRAWRIGPYDLIHLNEVTLLPVGLLAQKLLRLPLVVHVRSLQRGEARDARTRWFTRHLLNRADAVIAIDETVRRTLPNRLPVRIVHNGIRVCPEERGQTAKKRFRVGMIGGLLKVKGVYEFFEAARILLKEREIDAEFVVAGENARELSGPMGWLLRKLDLGHDVRADLESFAKAHNLEERVRLVGFVNDVQSIYKELDLLCFPSYLDAAGRPVFEAAFFSVPSVVAVRNPPSDTIVQGETGLCIDYPDARKLAEVIEYFYRNRDECIRMGENAKRLAHKNFVIENNAIQIYSIYESILAQRS
ncbi:glycosyl transferase group 1 family protein [Nitrococcus mobilis Nb-231]|uniref:Glycosyl transferase group 1 family protein n=2 Tax=Nitrococcus mobilis TaxID=35797 RepID=A4BMH3_9GAMM|nr:glycosyl transferase group 1 family protein [Nitrococcus mobilis Nb-231]